MALVLALAKRPRLLVLDEPVASLDPLARREFLSVLMDEAADGHVSVLLSSHALAELQRVADHLIVLNQGRVRLAGGLEEITATHRLVTGPGAPHAVEGFGQVIAARHFARHSQLLVRTATENTAMHPAWQAQPVTLEEIVLAYLQNPDPAPAGPLTRRGPDAVGHLASPSRPDRRLPRPGRGGQPAAVCPGRPDWILSSGLTGPHGVRLSDQATAHVLRAAWGAGGPPEDYLHAHRYGHWALLQPASRFWHFQILEATLYAALALTCLTIAIIVLRRRPC